MLLKDKIAIVTGAAQGIGSGIAEVFAREGAAVVVADIQDKKAAATAAEHARKTCLDISDQRAIGPFGAAVEKDFGRIDILVNNAGVQDWVPFLETTLEMWDRHFAVNVRGTFMLCQAVAKVMVRQGGGKIVNISSDSGVAPLPDGASAYCASKSAIIALTRNIAKELGRYKVYCNAICPGTINTAMTQRFLESPLQKGGSLELWAQMTALKRVGDPEDIGRVALFLASHLSDFITGEHLLATGGDTISQ